MEPSQSRPIAPPRIRASSSQRSSRAQGNAPPLPPSAGDAPARRSPSHQDFPSQNYTATNTPKAHQLSEETKRRNRSILRSKTQPIPINGVRALQREEDLPESSVPFDWDVDLPLGSDTFIVSTGKRQSQDRRSRQDRESSESPLSSSIKGHKESPLASSSPSRKVFKFFESRQNSFSSYLTQSRNESGSLGEKTKDSTSDRSDEPQVGNSLPPGILVRYREGAVSKSGSLQEIGTSFENSLSLRKRKDCIRRSVHFTEDEVKCSGNNSDVSVSLDTLKKTNHSVDDVPPVKKEDPLPGAVDLAAHPQRSIQKSSSTSFEGLSFPKKVSFQYPLKESEKILRNTTSYSDHISTIAAQSRNNELKSDNNQNNLPNSTCITRLGGVHSIKAANSSDSNTPDRYSTTSLKSKELLDNVVNSAYAKDFPLEDRQGAAKSHTYLSGETIFATLPRRNLVHKNDVAKQLSSEEESFNPPVSIKRRVLVASTGERQPERSPTSTPKLDNPHHTLGNSKNPNHTTNNLKSLPEEHNRTLENRNNLENPKGLLKNLSNAVEGFNEESTTQTLPKKLVKSSSTSTFRFFHQNIQLPSIPSKPSRKSSKEKASASTAAKKVFFSELKAPLSVELADYLYDKMKGTHEGILVTACRLGEEEQILKLIKELTANGLLDESLVNQKDKTGRTPLCHASMNGHVRVVAALTAVSATDLNMADSEGNTPLHLAAQAGHLEVVGQLVARCGGRVELDPRNNAGLTPLMKAALQGRTKIAKTLLFAGASPHLRDYGRGLSAPEWARYTGRHLCSDLIQSAERSCSDTVRGRWCEDPVPPGGEADPVVGDPSGGWFRHKLRRAFSNKADGPRCHTEYRVANKLPQLAKCATSPVLPPAVAASVATAASVNVIPSLQVTEVKAADCYQDPEEILKRNPSSSPLSSYAGSPQSSSNPTVVGKPPNSQYVMKDTPNQASSHAKKDNPTQNYPKHESSPSPSSSSDTHVDAGADTDRRPPDSKSSTSFRNDTKDASAGVQNRRTFSFSTPNSNTKGKPLVSGGAGSKPAVPQSVVTHTSGGRVVTGSVYSKTASVYTIQKSASATRFGSKEPVKFQASARVEDSNEMRSSSLDLGYSGDRGGVVSRVKNSANDARSRNSTEQVKKK